MKILFIAMPFSIHTVRWISQLENSGHELHFFSSFPYTDIHPGLKGLHYHDYYHTIEQTNRNIFYHPVWPFEIKTKNKLIKRIVGKVFRVVGLETGREKTLANIIKKIRPDIIHSMETQHAGYIVAEAKKGFRHFPKWMHSNWGIDLHFFGSQPGHPSKIKNVLGSVDIFIAEGNRDIKLAIEYGCRATTYTFPSVGGGFTIADYIAKEYILPSERKLILVKGTQDIVRRGLISLKAIEKCAPLLNNYEIIIYQCADEVITEAKKVAYIYGLNIKVLDEVSHEAMILLNQQARISITVNMSDGVPNSMLEAMLCGAFPIQSNTSCANEWIDNDKTGILVSPENTERVALALKQALSDNNLVDKAAEINFLKVSSNLGFDSIKEKTIRMYNNVLNS
jgi:glycosyltransferase involved in cell wall biosynthesis